FAGLYRSLNFCQRTNDWQNALQRKSPSFTTLWLGRFCFRHLSMMVSRMHSSLCLFLIFIGGCSGLTLEDENRLNERSLENRHSLYLNGIQAQIGNPSLGPRWTATDANQNTTEGHAFTFRSYLSYFSCVALFLYSHLTRHISSGTSDVLTSRMEKNLTSLSLFILLLQGCDAQSPTNLVGNMKDIWTALGGPPKYWSGDNVCNSTDYINVTCDSSRTYPIGISFDGINFNGSLSQSFGLLTNLTKIYVNNAHLNGSIPTSICNLTQLTQLDLGLNNYLSGDIPPCIGNLTNLVRLRLVQNQLTGNIPPLQKLTKLEQLSLGSNRLTGTIPDWICNLTNLVERLNFGTNLLTGPIPSCIGSLQSVTQIFLDNNRLTGSLPADLMNLRNLTKLDLHSNLLGGQVPLRNTSLPALSLLNLSSNHFTSTAGTIIASDCDLKNNFFSCYHYFNAPSCSYDQLPCPPLMGVMQKIWSDLGGSSQYWQGTNICDATDYIGVACDTNQSWPITINISAPLNGSLSSIGSLANLTTLIIDGGGLRGIIDPICNLLGLNVLRLKGSQLSGNISACIKEMKALIYIDLNQNSFTGSIPPMVSLPNLVSLNLADNHLTGSVPSSIFNLPSLKTLNLSNNQLSGLISNRIDQLPPLDSLNLSNNKFTSAGYINVSTFCNLSGIDFDCFPLLNVSQLCSQTIQNPCDESNIIDALYDDKTRITESEAKARVIKVISAIVLALLRNATSFDYISPNVSVNVQTYNGNGVIQSTLSNSSVGVTLPVLYTTAAEVSVSLSSLSFNPFIMVNNESIYSRVIGVSVYAGGAEIEVRNVSQLINISMGVIDDIPDGYNPICKYWNEANLSWSRDGCQLTVDGNVTMCQSTHLTNFSIGIMPIHKKNSVVTDTMPVAATEENKTKTLIIILVCSIVGGLILALIISVLIYRNFQLRQREHMETSLSVMVDVEEIEYEQKIAEGKRGQVWKCTYKGTTTVMVKKLTKDIEMLHHPDIVQYLGNSLRERYIMMEWMEGGSLHDYLSASSELTVETIGQGVSKGLSYITSMGMVHTAVVPKKIMLSERYIMMEWMEGGSLHDYLCASSELTVETMFVIGQGVSRGLSYITSMGMVHTAVVPKKIMLSGSHTMDVKLQCLMYVVTEDAPYEGKQRGLQTAPEIEKKKRYQTSGHVWSVGVLLWAMVTHNSHLYDNSDGSDIDFTTEKNVGERMAGLIRNCTEEREEKRPSLSQVTQRMMTERKEKEWNYDTGTDEYQT
ncbi:hypothetical protein PROFUN_16264, partial [Planoprotostelium fungivorum]